MRPRLASPPLAHPLAHPLTLPIALALATCALASASAAGGDDDGPPAVSLEASVVGDALGTSGIRPYGWVEASVSATPVGGGAERSGRVFDAENDGFRLHQACVALERLPAGGRCFDAGGKVVAMWGADARLTRSVGLLDDQTGDEVFDLVEAHALLRLPVGDGVTLKAGKFATTMGFEVIDAPSNALPSRSYLFGYAIPFTHVGALATLDLGEHACVSYGLVLGWDVYDDPNDALTHLASFSWTSPSEADTIAVNAVVGAERAGNDDDLRVVVDATWTHTWDGGWKTSLNADYGFEEGGAAGGDATWWGIAAYVTETISDTLCATLRAEVFRDEDGARLGTKATLSELTWGLDWTPFGHLPNFHLRPEIRWDHSYDGPFFHGGEDQVSVALDAVFTF